MISAAVPATWVIAGVGDLDGNGKADLVWRNMTTGDVAVWLGNGVQAPTTTSVITAAVPVAWSIVGVGDLDGDGKADLVWRNTVTGDVAAWLGNGVNTPTTMGVIAAAVPAAWVVAEMGDLDGNGTADLVWRHTSTGDVGAWLMNGLSASTTGVLASGVPLAWEIAGQWATWMANGTADLVWRETTGGAVTAWLMNGLSIASWGVLANSVSLAWEIAEMGDLDGNGTADLVWRHKSIGGVWGLADEWVGRLHHGPA